MIRLLLIVAALFSLTGCEYIQTLPSKSDGPQQIRPQIPKLP